MSIAANYIYNVFYQLIAIAIPFITVPYVSRVLGAEGIGINAYAGSILQYFILFGSLGIGLYGTRSIAYTRDDKEKLSKTFWSIFILQFFLCFVSLALYLLFVMIAITRYRVIYFILSLNLLATAIDVTWLFVGMEEFKKLVIRSIFFRLAGVISIFLFITSREDLWKYTAISSMSIILGQVVMWPYLFRIVGRSRVNPRDIIVHLKPSLKLFLPQAAIMVYLVLNRTLLGLMANKQEVGLYENADKVIKMSLAILTATGGVMLPRVSNSFANGDMTRVNRYVYTMLNFVSYLAIPMIFGISGISRQFVPWFFGDEFLKCSSLIILLSPLILIIAWSNVMGFQFMIPTKKTLRFTVSVSIGAAVSLILNLLLIKKYYSVGAAVSTVAAETAVTISQIVLLKGDLKFYTLKKNMLKYLISSTIMFIPVILIGYYFKASYITVLVQIFTGAVIYISLLFILKSDINNFIFTRIFKRMYTRFMSRAYSRP